MTRRPIILFILCVPILWLLTPYILGTIISMITAWPPVYIERNQQRREVLKRVGTWDALKQDCQTLCEQQRTGYFWWRRGDTNVLPHTIASLKPKEICFLSPAHLRRSQEGEHPAVVRIEIFGVHSTGGHSIPRFGLLVVCGEMPDGYVLEALKGPVNISGTIRPLTDRIYEITR